VSLKIALVGAVQSTERALQVLARSGSAPALLLTLPPEKSSRHSDYVDLHPLANDLGVSVLDIGDVNHPQILDRLAELDLDVAMVIGWSRLCGREFVALPRLGTIGFHPALLPAMRGRAALAWTILLDVRETGGTLFWIDDGVDSGPIAAQQTIALSGTETLAQLMDRQLEALGSMLEGLVCQLSDGARPAIEQDHSAATYLALRRPEDGEIDWTLSASDIERLIRAVSPPYPGAFTFLRGRKLKIWSARVASYPQWFALTGQIFTFDGEEPVVRCGGGTDLLLVDFELEEPAAAGDKAPSLRGQPRLGRSK
jgi:methionyl-tRNA formyltransferase